MLYSPATNVLFATLVLTLQRRLGDAVQPALITSLLGQCTPATAALREDLLPWHQSEDSPTMGLWAQARLARSVSLPVAGPGSVMPMGVAGWAGGPSSQLGRASWVDGFAAPGQTSGFDVLGAPGVSRSRSVHNEQDYQWGHEADFHRALHRDRSLAAGQGLSPRLTVDPRVAQALAGVPGWLSGQLPPTQLPPLSGSALGPVHVAQAQAQAQATGSLQPAELQPAAAGTSFLRSGSTTASEATSPVDPRTPDSD